MYYRSRSNRRSEAGDGLAHERTPPDATTKKTTTKPDRSTKQIEKVYVQQKGVGRVYKESSGRYVSQTRRTPGGSRTRRWFDTLKAAKADYAEAVAIHEAAAKS